MDAKFTVDSKQLNEALRGLGKSFESEFREIARGSARRVCEEYVKHSYPNVGNDPMNPMGNTDAAQKQGEKNLRKEVNSMFVPLDQMRVSELVLQKNDVVFNMNNPIQWRDEGLKRAWESRDMDTLYNAFSAIDTGYNQQEGSYDYDEGSLFKEQDFKQFQYVDVPSVAIQQQMRGADGKWDGKTKALVRNRQVIQQFIQKRMQDIGKMVNGWNECLRQLGGGAIYKMLGKGFGSVTVSDGGLTYNIVNKNGDFNQMISKTGVPKLIQLEEQTRLKAEVDRRSKITIAKWFGRTK
jgi:hypothetical protein